MLPARGSQRELASSSSPETRFPLNLLVFLFSYSITHFPFPFSKGWRGPHYGTFNECWKGNASLSQEVSNITQKIAPSVVFLVSSTGDRCLRACSGTIIDSKEVDGAFFSTILTSATLLRRSHYADEKTADLKIDVYTTGGKILLGRVLDQDSHYKIATIGIKTEMKQQKAIIRHIEPCGFYHLTDSTSLQLSCPGKAQVGSNIFYIHPGDQVVALGLHFQDPCSVMAAPGEFSLDCCHLDCEELFMSSCRITLVGIGGPLINCYGEVIGINLDSGSGPVPFLPINIASKCLAHWSKYRCIRRPWLGMVVGNLYEASLEKLEKVIQQFADMTKPLVCYKSEDIYRAFVVKEVIRDSPVDLAGVHVDDVIVYCNGSVAGFMQCNEMAWDKVGEHLTLFVLRPSTGVTFEAKVLVKVADNCKINSGEVLTYVCRRRAPEHYY